ncbi:MAG: TetR family transcriptional regulator [Gammaproteobacteria bacterium]|jgi:TetR/AcrR family transcriptional regulator|nr:TetR family transcriptional regulator [Gammaproteobacteria bacterium]
MGENAAETRWELQKDRMLRAAAQCFNQKGYSGSSLKDVANILGLTDAALYYYVKNKEELVYLCYVRAGEVGQESMDRAVAEGSCGLDTVTRYIRYHVEAMTGERGPVAILSEIPSLQPEHREEVLQISRDHGTRFEALLERGIEDGSIAPCDVRMTGNAIMGALNWVPKWFHGDADVAENVIREFPKILGAGLTTTDRQQSQENL